MLPIPTTNLNLDLFKLWGNILLSSAATTIPTSYFLQGVQIVDSATDTSSLDSTSLLPEKAEHASRTSSGLRRELNEAVDIFARGSEASEEDSDDGYCEEGDGRGGRSAAEQGQLKKCRIQRMRYGREEYKCPTCPYHCTTEHAYIRHLRTTCTGNPPTQQRDKGHHQLPHPQGNNDQHLADAASVQVSVSCCVCGRDRSGDRSLALHMQRHRTGKHFRCDLCHFQTLQLKKLIQHRRMHTGEKPHLCPHCPYRSARRDNLRSHVRRVHKKDNLLEDTFTPSCMLISAKRSCAAHAP